VPDNKERIASLAVSLPHSRLDAAPLARDTLLWPNHGRRHPCQPPGCRWQWQRLPLLATLKAEDPLLPHIGKQANASDGHSHSARTISVVARVWSTSTLGIEQTRRNNGYLGEKLTQAEKADTVYKR
jgi:hypothetical protein